MPRRLLRLVPLLALIAAFLRPPPAHAQRVTIEIAVGRDGFNGITDYELTLEAGQEVTLTFIYADGDLPDDNPHEMVIVGLEELGTVTVSRAQPTATLTFTPSKSGTFRLICIIPCEGMWNLTSGVVRVEAPPAGGAPAALSLALTPHDGQSVLARATLAGSSGRPLAEALVTFVMHTTVGGQLPLGAAYTAADGSAVMKVPTIDGEPLNLTAHFAGGEGRMPAEASASFTAPGPAMDHRPTGLSAPTPPPMLAIALLVVLGGVWATYGFVVYQVSRIPRS